MQFSEIFHSNLRNDALRNKNLSLAYMSFKNWRALPFSIFMYSMHQVNYKLQNKKNKDQYIFKNALPMFKVEKKKKIR